MKDSSGFIVADMIETGVEPSVKACASASEVHIISIIRLVNGVRVIHTGSCPGCLRASGPCLSLVGQVFLLILILIYIIISIKFN